MSKRKKEKQDVPDKVVKARKSEKTPSEVWKTEVRDFVVEVKTLLRNKTTLLSGLNKLRDALKSKESESFAVFKEFTRENSECPEVYKVLERGRQQQTPLELQITLEILENLLLFTAEDTSSFGQIGMYHVRRLLHNHLKLIYSCLNPTCHVNMIKGALRLLVAMVTQGASAAREIVAVFDFTLKALGSIVNKRDSKVSEDIRTCFIHFVMSFLMYGDDATIRHVLDIKGFVTSIFKLFSSDSPDVVHLVLTVLHQKVVQNNAVPKKTKVQFFSSYVLTKLASLYNYDKEENKDEEGAEEKTERPTIKERIHNMLQDICCTFKFGICFANKLGMFSGRSNNPVLLRFLQSLPKHDQDLHLQQLVIQILTCCPDLIQPYLSNQSTTYEPRLSLPWLTNINFIITLYSGLPLPSVMVEKSSISVTKESVQLVLNAVVPSVLTRANINQGVQHSSLLVKNTTLSMLILIMKRANDLLGFCEQEIQTKAEQLPPGLSFVEMFRDILIKAVPDVKTIISLRQNLVASIQQPKTRSQDGKEVSMEDEVVTPKSTECPTLLLPSVLQALYFYQRVQPSVFSTAAFDLGKLLPGQHDVIDKIFPPIVQHYTLEILLDLPPGVFKWYQQKCKSSPPYMYSILKIYLQSSSDEIKAKSKKLIAKVLQDAGIIAQGFNEIDTWLKHLHTFTSNHGDETLLVFLDSVCHSVAMEPYTYTDVVMEMTSEAKAWQANGETFSLLENVEEHLHSSYDSRASFSPLIVRALMDHVEMCSAAKDVYTSSQLCSIAKYINLVFLDILRDMMNPLPLILAVKRFYGNKEMSVDCASLKTTHQSLLRYVDKWIEDSTSLKAEDITHHDDDETRIALEHFLTSQASNPSQESLTSFLGELDESQLKKAVGPCVQLCMSQFAGNLRPIVDELTVKPYCVIDGVKESIFPLLKVLPFLSLLWQVFGSLFDFQTGFFEHDETSSTSFERKRHIQSSFLVRHPGVQTFLVEALKKEDLSTFPRHCNSLLQYLSAFISKARKSFSDEQKVDRVQDNARLGQGKRSCRGKKRNCKGAESGIRESQSLHMTVYCLVFQLVELMIERLDQAVNSYETFEKSKQSPNVLHDTGSPLLEHESTTASQSRHECLQIQENFFSSLLQSPVLLNCFLFKFDSEKDRLAPGVCRGLTFCIGNLFQAIVSSIKSESQLNLLKPYTRKICDKAVDEVTKATADNELSSDGQALQLLEVFSPFCDQECLSKPITKLLELPFKKLVRTAGNRLQPTTYMQTLLALLDSQPYHVTPTSNQKSFSDDVIKGLGQNTSLCNQRSPLVDVTSHVIKVPNQKRSLLSVSDFRKVTKLLIEVPCAQLDRVILKILKTTPQYLLEIDSCFLDHCLDNVTEDRVAIATMLIATSANLRAHFEQRCTCANRDDATKQLNLKNHLWDLLPVVHWYFSYAESVEALSFENKVLSCLLENFWSCLWKWIREPKSDVRETQDLSCAVLKFLIIMKSDDIKESKKLFSKLLDLIPSQSWDVYQMSTIRTMLDLLLTNSTDDNEKGLLVATTVSVCMVNISLMLELNSDSKSLIDAAVSMLSDIVSKQADFVLQVEISFVELETWSTFVKNCLRYRYDCAMTLQCMTACVQPLYNSTKDKTLSREFPLTTMYQLILSHSKFLEIMLEDNAKDVSLKESLLDLVVAIAELCPECCQPSHLSVFFGSYTATLSKADQSILYLLHLYERGQVSLSSYRPYLWGKAALEHHKVKKLQGPSLWQQPSTNEVLELLDVTTLNRSALDFPLERKLKPRVQSGLVLSKENHSSLYDPCFLIPLFCHLLSQNSVVDCRKFVERGGLGYTVAALSSRDSHMRKAASHVLSRCMTHMETASFREKKQVYLLLESLKNGISDADARVSGVITRFVSRAAYIMLHPENQMYVLVNSFLLQRSVMDLREVPLFYTLFNSSSLQHRNERIWILQLLVEGLRDAQDYYVYKKRHVMELAMSYHDSQISDQQSRKLVISLISAALSLHAPTFDLAKNYAMVGWIHSLCLTSPKDGERLSCSLQLLHKLWFTIQQGKPSVCSEVGSGDEHNNTPFPPNLGVESLLVCKTLVRLYSSDLSLKDLTMLFKLLGSVLAHLSQTSTQESHLTHLEILQLIKLWCRMFSENQVFSLLAKEVQSTEQEAGNKTSDSSDEGVFKNEKQTSLNLLLDIIAFWRPTLSVENDSNPDTTADSILLLSCNFVLHFASISYQTTDAFDKSLLKMITWFRYCLASNSSLQKLLLGHMGQSCLKRLLCLYGFANGAKLSFVQELNMIFLVLVSRVQHMNNDSLGSTANEIAGLLSSNVYQEIMASGVVDVLLPLCPSPLTDDVTEKSAVEVTQLISVFLKDLWFSQQVPLHFLSLVSLNQNSTSSKLRKVFRGGSAKLQEITH